MKTRRFTLFIVTCSLLIALAFFGCKEDPDPTPQPHSGTITAFGKDITVKGDGSISKTNFDSALEKLQEAMGYLYDNFEDMPSVIKNQFNTMLNHDGFSIIIDAGNACPAANADKSMTIGVEYLLKNDRDTIAGSILTEVTSDAFAD